MLTGKQFLLSVEVLALQEVDGKRVAVRLPTDSVLHVISGPTPADPRMVEVGWAGHQVLMFAEDVQRYGREVKNLSNSAPAA